MLHCYRETITQPHIHIYLPPTPLLKHTTFSCGSVYLKHLRNSPFSTNDFLFVDHYGYSRFTWNHNHCRYNKLSVMCKADVMSRRHLFSFSCLLLHRLCQDAAEIMFIHSHFLFGPLETMHLLHPL